MSWDYELMDSGDQRRLENFSGVIVNRPAPQALWPKNPDIKEWHSAHAFYHRPESGQGHWDAESSFPENWQLAIEDVKIHLKPTANSQIGVFPEQLVNWQWINNKLSPIQKPVQVLNAFAYTGVATLMASSASPHVEVCHVDGAKQSVQWARKNAELSGLTNRPIRWIVDDVMTFLQREIKRGRKYDAFILDPPAFGRGSKGNWKIERDLPQLITAVKQLLTPQPLFVLLSCHAPQLEPKNLIELLESITPFFKEKTKIFPLTIPSTKGHLLPSGLCARIE